MVIESQVKEDIRIINILEKRLDLNSSKDFKEKMISYINQGPKGIALDLSGIEFIDSSGLAVLISILKLMGNSGKLVLFGARDHVLGLFKLTRMDRVFDMAKDQAEASQKLSR